MIAAALVAVIVAGVPSFFFLILMECNKSIKLGLMAIFIFILKIKVYWQRFLSDNSA